MSQWIDYRKGDNHPEGMTYIAVRLNLIEAGEMDNFESAGDANCYNWDIDSDNESAIIAYKLTEEPVITKRDESDVNGWTASQRQLYKVLLDEIKNN